MTQEEITKAFENRWRFKSENHPEAWVKGVKALCRGFFEAGVTIGSLPASSPSHASPSSPPPALSSPPPAPGRVGRVLAPSEDPLFETWWNLYQKKRGKEKCMKKWAKLSQKEKQDCIAATPAYVASTPDVIFRKDPYTYLNNSSWKDEIYYRNGSTPQHHIEKLAEILAD